MSASEKFQRIGTWIVLIASIIQMAICLNECPYNDYAFAGWLCSASLSFIILLKEKKDKESTNKTDTRLYNTLVFLIMLGCLFLLGKSISLHNDYAISSWIASVCMSFLSFKFKNV